MSDSSETLGQRLIFVGMVLAGIWSIVQIAFAFLTSYDDLVLLPLHLAFALAVTFALIPAIPPKEKIDEGGELVRRRSRIDVAVSVVVILASIAIAAYYMLNVGRLVLRIPQVDELTLGDTMVGIAVVVFVVEAARRTAGLGMTVVVLIFIAYAFVGPSLPLGFRHSGLSLTEFIDLQTLTTDGIFGVPTGVSATYVFYFILFGAFLDASGGGRLFIDLATTATGRYRGGAAKAATTASALMGMTSGSAVANVMGTGIFTIPLMKRTGYAPHVAGSVEALASTGGQIMPPLMGAAAFIIAQNLGLPYSRIVSAAVIPAAIYYLAVLIAVDLEARYRKIQPIPAADQVPLRQSLMRLHLLLPLVYLVYSVMVGRQLMMAAVESIGVVLVVSLFSAATRIGPRGILKALADGGSRAIMVAIPCAAAGIIVGIVVQTGIGVRFTELLVGLSRDNLLICLLAVSAGCIIMGMGLPTTAAYIMGATLFVPALAKLGINPLAAHFFVFYFACLSMITPPVALASYAAASIAGASASRVGWTTVRFGLPAFLVPFAFVVQPAMILEGSMTVAAVSFVTALIGVYALAAGNVGYLRRKNRPVEGALLIAAAIALIYPSLWISLAGGLVLVLVYVWQGREGSAPELGTSTSGEAAKTVLKGRT
ncbi:TRAP transporter permease [Propylenella binzhouense]|uniref:TRAP transporter fused permease subunit n=1 Tax=Propylenella binzhouense TaxID=2555902 RepID=A0A964T2N3_9HYPH|nr:TRAP transporter fused permease subunit [Propylenella binzhouense]MYZ47125.1 TRAP transporter fused permease subunit [Propylenella binzhouense]